MRKVAVSLVMLFGVFMILVDGYEIKGQDCTLTYGDFDGDGKTGINDLVGWYGSYRDGYVSEADFNYDGKIDVGDVIVWYQSYRGILTETLTLIPEPNISLSVSSQLNDSFDKNNLIDGNPTTAWSSNWHESGDFIEWISMDLGKEKEIDGFLLTPRVYNGIVQAFPKEINISYSVNGTDWNENNILKNFVFDGNLLVDSDNFHQVARDVYLKLDVPKMARYFSLGFTLMGQDSYGGYFSQMAEIKPVEKAKQSNFASGVRFEKKDGLTNQWLCCDSFMMTSKSDGEVVSSCSDGVGMEGASLNEGCSYKNSYFKSNFLYRVNGDVEQNLQFEQMAVNPLEVMSGNWGHYIVNSFGLGQDVYVSIVSRVGKLAGVGKLVGNSVVFNKQVPMWNGSQRQPFMFATFLQNGLGYSGNNDGYVYIYGTNGNWGKQNLVYLARVKNGDDITVEDNYSYYSQGNWVKDVNLASVVIEDGDRLAGMGSAIYNPILKRYFYMTFAYPQYKQPSLGNPLIVVYDAPFPWGPWYRTGEVDGKTFINSPEVARIPGDTFYNPSFNPKWVDANGDMWITFSDNHLMDGDLNYTMYLGKLKIIR